jgi:hypothetical protein
VFIEVYTPDFLQVCEDHGREERQLRRCLGEVGLVVGDRGIALDAVDPGRWGQVSMLGRLDPEMPSTSNAIEWLNGHMNDDTPRNNTFWGSLERIDDIFTEKIINFDVCLRHNVRRRGVVYQRLRAVPMDQVMREIGFFGSHDDSCPCGETVMTSRMYRLNIPCNHRVFLVRARGDFCYNAEAFPRGLEEPLPQIERLAGLVLLGRAPGQFGWEILPVEVHERDNFRDGEIEHLVRLIVRDAYAQRRREEVRAFVEDQLPRLPGSAFALHESSEFWEVHRAGLQLFRSGSPGDGLVPRRGAGEHRDSSDSSDDGEYDPHIAPRGRGGSSPDRGLAMDTRRSRAMD